MVSTAVMATTRADHAATNDQGGSCPSPQAAVTACDADREAAPMSIDLCERTFAIERRNDGEGRWLMIKDEPTVLRLLEDHPDFETFEGGLHFGFYNVTMAVNDQSEDEHRAFLTDLFDGQAWD